MLSVRRPGRRRPVHGPAAPLGRRVEGEGDLGRRGMALFFATVDAEATKGLFEPLGIPQFELSPAERRRAATQDEDEEPQKRSSVRFSGIPDKSTQSRHDEARRLSIMGARRVRLEAQKSVRTLCKCDEINAELEDVSTAGGATACAARALLDAIDDSASSGTPRTSCKLEVAVAEVHAGARAPRVRGAVDGEPRRV